MKKYLTQIVVILLAFTGMAFAQATDGDGIKDRLAIERLIYEYAITFDSKDCVGYSNLFIMDGSLDLSGAMVASGRDGIRQVCSERQKTLVGQIKTHHNIMNIVFDKLTPQRAETRSYCILTWQKANERTITIVGSYLYSDIFVKADGGKWMFKERKSFDLTNLP